MGVRVNHKQVRTLPPGGLIIAINLQSSPDVVLGVHRPPLLLAPPPAARHTCKKSKTQASWIHQTALLHCTSETFKVTTL